jgi:hypothetical protein
MVDQQQEMPRTFRMDDLREGATVITRKDDRWCWMATGELDEPFERCALILDLPPPPDRFNVLVSEACARAEAADRVEVDFTTVAAKLGVIWSQDSSTGIETILGPDTHNGMQSFKLGAEATLNHGLIVGMTGSGTSNLLHVLISTLAWRYSPDELELYLIDFKQGVEFKPYAHYQLPHASVIAIESEREFGLSVLRGLAKEQEERAELLRNSLDSSIAGLRRAGHRMPRIVLIIDEFQMFFTQNDSLAAEAARLLDQLTRQGRSYGIHVLLASQTIHTSTSMHSLPSSTLSQMGIRVVLRCQTEADARAILAEGNTVAARFTRSGQAVYNTLSGRIEGNEEFQVVHQTNEAGRGYDPDRL